MARACVRETECVQEYGSVTVGISFLLFLLVFYVVESAALLPPFGSGEKSCVE